jgi:peptidoglycan/xylan/chitin deacetylase (PgdA/CDA1 family)
MNLISRAKRKIKRELRNIFHPPYGEILALHCVVEKRSRLDENRAMEITPVFLEQTILKYQSAGYRFVSLDEVQQQIEKQKRSRRKFVCFTLDDGYADNYKYAYPVFQKYNCPFAIYITTDYPDRKAQFWWNQSEEVLLQYEKLTINSVEYDCSDLEKKNKAFWEIREKIYSPDDAEMTLTALQQLFKENNCDADDLALSWEQIIELASDPLCTIAAHSVTHASLPALSDEMIIKELSEGKKRIEEKIKMPVKHFSYPYGNCDSRVVDLVKEQFSTAVLNRGGFVQKDDNLYMLNRKILFEQE